MLHTYFMLQSGQPVFLPNLRVIDSIGLEQLLDSDGKPQQHNEAFLRDLIYRSPEVLPIGEIEPMLKDAKSICIELPNPAGFVDNLLVTSDGGIVLVECKLQRNLQARREVIAQIMDYAAQLQKWTFEDLDLAVRNAALPESGSPSGLIEAFENKQDFDPLEFMDAITRNLRRGRLLLLIVGDGIREGLESLTEILQRHPGFHAALGLIELKLYSLPSGGYIVQPRTLLRTLNIVRGVVTFTDDRVSVQQPEDQVKTRVFTVGASKRATTMTEDEYYSCLATKNPAWPSYLKDIVAKLEQIGLTVEFKRSLIMRWSGSDEYQHNVITFRKFGRIVVDALSWHLHSEQGLAAANEFRHKIAQILGGMLQENGKDDQNIWVNGRVITLNELSGHELEFIEAVRYLIQQLQKIDRDQEGRI